MNFLYIEFDSPRLYIWAACIGFNLAVIISYFLKSHVNSLISKLYEAQAYDENSAVSLSSLSLNNLVLRYLLRNGSTLRKVVKTKNDRLETVNHKGKDKTDFEKSLFYLDTSNEKKILSLQKGVIKWWLIPVFALVSVIMAEVIIYLLPYLSVL